MKNTVVTLGQQKVTGEKITMLTAYDYSVARLFDEAGVNVLLVGDSLGMVMLGYPDTLSVTMDDMVHHTAAVARGAQDAFVLGDMPYMSYQVSTEQAVRNAGRLVTEGRAQGVKLEGGAAFVPEIRAMVRASIPVCGHLGLTPQSLNAFGGFKVQGKSAAPAIGIVEDALALEDAGCFMVVLEGIPAELAAFVTERLSIPTIGIGAGAGCDGQVLVYQDMLNMFGDLHPKFVKVMADVGAAMKAGVGAYIDETRAGAFPGAEHGYGMDAAVMDEVRGHFK
jgi:3-methyl-2-oxobutanoate hydroxymethyltransferase